MSNTFRPRILVAGGKQGAARTVRPRQVVSPLAAHLGYWLRVVSNHVSHAFKAKVERYGVTVAEWVVLRALLDSDGIKPSALSADLGLTRGAVSKLLDRLETKELIAIRGDARDGRAQLVTLTLAGRRLVPKLAAAADENDREAFGHLSPEQRGALLSTLEGIVSRLGISGTPVD